MSELAEGARLEIVCAVISGTEGSNPSLSAINCLKTLSNRFGRYTTGSSQAIALSNGQRLTRKFRNIFAGSDATGTASES